MKNQENQDKSSATNADELSLNDDFKELVEALTEDSQAKRAEQTDPFEEYIERIRLKFHHDQTQFQSRLVQGYLALVKELRNSR